MFLSAQMHTTCSYPPQDGKALQKGHPHDLHCFALVVFVDFKFKNHGLLFVKGLSAGLKLL
jgi:hypothetical protein